MSMEEYKSALKAGQKDYRAHVARGQNPYLPVLDDILVNVEIVATEPLGLVNMPSESIVGTKTSGRHTAFAPNFMPLLDEDTEFATKWSVLCNAHLDEGIRNPVTAYEFLNQFYIEEGNKRVSVLKHFDSASIPGTVTRLIPARNDSLENRIYYEFLDFYKLSKVNIVQFSRLGSYAKLQKLVCKASGEEWTDDDRKNFNALHTKFRKQFRALGGAQLPLTVGDALLVYLSVYRYTDACDATPAQIKANLSKMWDEITVLTKDQAVEVVLEPQTEAASPLAKPLSGLSKLNIFTRPSELRVTFIHEYNEAVSAWVRAHEKGRDALANTFGDRVILSSRENVDPEVDAEQVLEEVAHDGADVVFTTSVRMHTACLKVAAQHPKTKFLNCSLNAPHPLVRTYYPRTYEATYILGMLAGILSPTNVVGYVAPNPVYGIPAAVNAYAQGLRSVRPEGRVLLRGACLPDPEHPLNFSDREDVTLYYARDSREAPDSHRDYGLCQRLPNGVIRPLGLPEWRWDVVYTEIIRSILNGSWDAADTGKAINYWWGMKSGAVGIRYSHGLPGGSLQLLGLMETQLHGGLLTIFPAQVYGQKHLLHSPQKVVYTPKELMMMDWLDECVEGSLPSYDQLDVKTRALAEICGLDVIKDVPAQPAKPALK